MNTLVVIDSQCGGTGQIAQVIVSILSHYGKVQTVDVTKTNGLDLNGVEMVIVGGPTQRWKPSSGTIQAFLDNIPEGTLKPLSLASFNTQLPMPQFVARSAEKGLNKKLRKTGGALLLPSERFLALDRTGRLKNGEVERAARWARTDYRMHKAQQVFRRN